MKGLKYKNYYTILDSYRINKTPTAAQLDDYLLPIIEKLNRIEKTRKDSIMSIPMDEIRGHHSNFSSFSFDSQPFMKIDSGLVTAALWATLQNNSHDLQKAYFTITFGRDFRRQKENWNKCGSFTLDDISDIINLCHIIKNVLNRNNQDILS
jgi:hypothetical protein